MKHSLSLPLILKAILLVFALSVSTQAQDQTKIVLAHYMSWYASKPISGEWGWHWTMNRFNPEMIKNDGQHEIASHDSPLMGPYDSGDDHALESHVLLMKFAGLSGVVIDWYGIAEFRDYAMIHRNTQRLIAQVKRAGLRFAICYEDQSIKHMIEAGKLQKSDEVAEGSRAMKWLADQCFADPAYVSLKGRPLLLVFGPQHFAKEQIDEIMSGLPKRPLLFGLPHLSEKAGMEGAFGWPPVSGGREVTREVWMDYLKRLHSKDVSISVAFPAFRDIYKEAGLHDSYGSIDGRGGKTFQETLTMAMKSRSQVIQVATWNDFGEGTVVEPTIKNQYQYLEAIQETLLPRGRFTSKDLRLPVKLYELRKRHAKNPDKLAELQQASDLLFAGKCEEARALLDEGN